MVSIQGEMTEVVYVTSNVLNTEIQFSLMQDSKSGNGLYTSIISPWYRIDKKI